MLKGEDVGMRMTMKPPFRVPMAAIARFGELGKCPGEIRVVLPLDRFAETRERRPALILDQPCERNALVGGIELRRRGKTL